MLSDMLPDILHKAIQPLQEISPTYPCTPKVGKIIIYKEGRTYSGWASSTPEFDAYCFEDGDITVQLCINGVYGTGKISSVALSKGSPVWKLFLHPCKGFPQPVTTIDFSEDDPTALLVLLQIAHTGGLAYTPAITVEFVINLAMLCDIYNCLPFIRPSMLGGQWCRILQGFRNPDYLSPKFEALSPLWGRALFACWVLGLEDLFEASSKVLLTLLKCRDGVWGWGVSDKFIPILEPFPYQLLESLQKLRQAEISKVFDTLAPCYNLPRAPQPRLVRELEKRNIRIKESMERSCNLSLSVQSLKIHLKNIRKALESTRFRFQFEWLDAPYEGPKDSEDKKSHHGLLEKTIRGCVIADIPSPVLECHRIHMAAQREELGVDESWGTIYHSFG